MNEPGIEVRHQRQRQRFVVTIDDQEAFLEYRMLAPDVIDFVHTYTPAELRGRGLAAQLVQTGTEFAHDRGWRIIATCSYVAAWLKKHQA